MAYIPAPDERDLSKVVRSIRNAHERLTSISASIDSLTAAITALATEVATTRIQFPAAQVPSSDSNALDDYEEGSWTPSLTFATPGNLSITYVEQNGRYVKIGKFVLATFGITTSSFAHTTASGNALITNFPFPSESVVVMRFMAGLNWQGITKANYTDIVARIDSGGGTSAFLSASGSGQALAQVTAADMPSGGTIILRGSVAYLAED